MYVVINLIWYDNYTNRRDFTKNSIKKKIKKSGMVQIRAPLQWFHDQGSARLSGIRVSSAFLHLFLYFSHPNGNESVISIPAFELIFFFETTFAGDSVKNICHLTPPMSLHLYLPDPSPRLHIRCIQRPQKFPENILSASLPLLSSR